MGIAVPSIINVSYDMIYDGKCFVKLYKFGSIFQIFFNNFVSYNIKIYIITSLFYTASIYIIFISYKLFYNKHRSKYLY